MDLKDRIKDLRDKKGLSQLQLAKISGSTSATISRLESGGIKEIKSSFAIKLADALGVSIDYLVGRTDKLKIGEFIELDEENASVLRNYMSLNGENRKRLREGLGLLRLRQELEKQLKKQLMESGKCIEPDDIDTDALLKIYLKNKDGDKS